jgi:hypothetical protein
VEQRVLFGDSTLHTASGSNDTLPLSQVKPVSLIRIRIELAPLDLYPDSLALSEKDFFNSSYRLHSIILLDTVVNLFKGKFYFIRCNFVQKTEEM